MATNKVTLILGAVDKTKGAFASVDKGIKGISAAHLAMATAAVAAVGTMIAKYVQLADQMADVGDQFDKMSQRTGVSVEALSELGYSAELSGASVEAVEKGVRKLAMSMYDAGRGSKEYADAFSSLGISVTDADGKLRPVEDVLVEMADALSGVTSESERSALAQKLLGKSGAMLLPMLQQGSQAIKDQAIELRALGALMGTDYAKASADFVDAQARMGKATDGLKMLLTQPFISQAADDVTELALALGGLSNKAKEASESEGFGALLAAIIAVSPSARRTLQNIANLRNGIKGLADDARETAAALEQSESAYVFGSGDSVMTAPLFPGMRGPVAGDDEDDAKDAEDAAKRRIAAIGLEIDATEKYLDVIRTRFRESTEWREYADAALAEMGASNLIDVSPEDMLLDGDWAQQLEDDLERVAKSGKDAGYQIGESFKNAFADAMIQMALFDADAEQVFKSLAAMALRIAVGGLFKDGGTVGGMAQGGSIPHAAHGFAVPDGPRGLDSMLIRAMPGEEVINRRLSQRLDRWLAFSEATMAPDGLAGGRGGGSVSVHTGFPVRRADAILMRRGVEVALRDMKGGTL